VLVCILKQPGSGILFQSAIDRYTELGWRVNQHGAGIDELFRLEKLQRLQQTLHTIRIAFAIRRIRFMPDRNCSS
jgi:hypothetical protein